jgi:hypothetical protein
MKSMPGGPTTIACSVDAYLQPTAAAKCKPLLLCASVAQRNIACVVATTSQPAMNRKNTSQNPTHEKNLFQHIPPHLQALNSTKTKKQ